MIFKVKAAAEGSSTNWSIAMPALSITLATTFLLLPTVPGGMAPEAALSSKPKAPSACPFNSSTILTAF